MAWARPAVKRRRTAAKSIPWLVDPAVAHNVSIIVIGELKGIRTNKDWGSKGNRKLHAWPFEKIVKLPAYKAPFPNLRDFRIWHHLNRPSAWWVRPDHLLTACLDLTKIFLDRCPPAGGE